MRVGIATDHGGFGLKEDLRGRLSAAGHDVVEFGALKLDSGDDYPDFVLPLAKAVAAGKVERGARTATNLYLPPWRRLRSTSSRVIGLFCETHDRREHRRAMNVLAIFPSEYVCRADLQRLSRSQNPGPRRQFITLGRR
jgi:hypothetical protein